MSNNKNPLKSLIVLYVEDEKEIRDALAKALNDEFKQFILASDGLDGLKKFNKFHPDIIVADIAMPLMDGLEMAKQIKNISKVPIVILSAYSDKDKLLQAINIGIDKYLMKPIDLEELLEILMQIAVKRLEIEDIIDIGNNYKFDKTNKKLIFNSEPIRLTKKELHFLHLLVRKPGNLVMHEEIIKVVWNGEKVNNTAIRAFIKRLRDKIGHDTIENIQGLGYKINTGKDKP